MFFNFYYLNHLRLVRLEREYSTGKRACTPEEHCDIINTIKLNMCEWISDPEGGLGDTQVEVDITSTANIAKILYKQT